MGLMPSYYSTTATRKRKTKGLTAADRAARVEHDKYLRSLGIDPKKRKVAQPGSAPALGAGGREFESRLSDQSRKVAPTSDRIPGFCPKKEVMVYSGERKLLGIAAMHKSSLIPIWSADEAKEVARMRRG